MTLGKYTTMDDIHESLMHFFSGDADDLQRKRALEFKTKNPKEFQLLNTLWDHKGEISIIDKDSRLAWKKFQASVHPAKSEKPSVVPLFKYWRQLAAAVVLVASVFFWHQTSNVEEQWVSIEVTSKENLTLSDGSMVYLNEGASISFPKGFDENLRVVKLDGEAFFDVVKDSSRPFSIITESMEIRVLGTSFNVFSSEASSEVSVIEGIVEVKQANGQGQIVLTQGYAAVINELGLSKKDANVNVDAWNTGVFFFEDTDLGDAVESLNTYYDNKIVLESVNADCNLTAKFHVEDLDVIVEILSNACGLEVMEMDGRYIIEE